MDGMISWIERRAIRKLRKEFANDDELREALAICQRGAPRRRVREKW